MECGSLLCYSYFQRYCFFDSHLIFRGVHKLRLHEGGRGVTWVQTCANQGGGGCLGPANVCNNAMKSQLSLKTFPKIIFKEIIA